ncbi:MAG: PLP-dependent aminotransferase family protein [Phycisphaeraceae bacterium]
MKRTIVNTSNGRLYEAVADHVAALIDAGTLRPGERTPSVRQLCRQLGVSTSTVMEAYRLLESRGRVRARPQSGYFVRESAAPVLSEPAPSTPGDRAQPVTVSSLAASLAARIGSADVLQLGAAVPAPELLPLQTLSRLYARLAREHRDTAHGYIPPPGYLPLRRQIAKRLIEAGCTRSPDDVLITNGATEAVQLCLRAVTTAGDTVAVESPTFYGSLETLESLGLHALEVPTNPRDGMNLDALAAAMQGGTVKAVLLSTNFANPLGTLMPEASKRRLVELAAAHQVPIIDDDIYGDLSYAPPRPAALAAFDTHGWVVSVGSLSKIVSPGLRIGWCCPGRFAEQVLRLKLAASHANAGLPQIVAGTFLAEGRYERHVRHLQRFYGEQAERFRQAIARAFPPATRMTRPRGGHVVWVEMPIGVDSLKLYDEALASGISIAPGPLFSASGLYRNCLRLNTAVSWSPRVEEAIQTLGRLSRATLDRAG